MYTTHTKKKKKRKEKNNTRNALNGELDFDKEHVTRINNVVSRCLCVFCTICVYMATLLNGNTTLFIFIIMFCRTNNVL